MSNDEDDEIKALLSSDDGHDTDASSKHNHVDAAIKKTRESLAQRETLAFVLIKLWTTIAKILAPLFAQAARYQAENMSHHQNDDNHSRQQ